MLALVFPQICLVYAFALSMLAIIILLSLGSRIGSTDVTAEQ